jgi:hypothetical protein
MMNDMSGTDNDAPAGLKGELSVHNTGLYPVLKNYVLAGLSIFSTKNI